MPRSLLCLSLQRVGCLITNLALFDDTVTCFNSKIVRIPCCHDGCNIEEQTVEVGLCLQAKDNQLQLLQLPDFLHVYQSNYLVDYHAT
jgi:hypothetical protein